MTPTGRARKRRFYLLSLLILPCALCSCQKVNNAVSVDVERNRELYQKHTNTPRLKIQVRSFETIGITGHYREAERRYKDCFIRYLRNSLMDTVVSNVSELGAGVKPDVILDVSMRANHTEERTFICDACFIYPGLGFLPIPNPQWGDINTDLSINAFAYNRPGQVNAKATESYSVIFYSWYRTGPVEDAYRKAYAAIFEDALLKLAAWLTPLRTMRSGESQPAAPATPSPALSVTPPAPPVEPAPAGPPKKIAVLEFRNTANLTRQESEYVTDLVRGAALRLPRTRFFVMTRENILEMLPPDVDLATCEGQCEVETGRNVGGDYVVTGEILKFGTSLKVTMKLHDTQTSALLASSRASAKTVDALEEPILKAAEEMFQRIPR